MTNRKSKKCKKKKKNKLEEFRDKYNKNIGKENSNKKGWERIKLNAEESRRKENDKYKNKNNNES